MLKKLGERNIVSLLVEGGGELFSGFIKKKLEDEILLFMGPKILGNGIPLCNNLGIKGLSKAFSYGIKDIEKVGEDAFIRFVRR
jgi:diaminohydroxyphosphoribosylaminopyrimidine deaminase/5-amino-6-(5-phosphoribosylamino)uracil reductase